MTESRRPRVVVTGANGYLGSRIAAHLANVAEVVPLVRPSTQRGSERAVPLNDPAALAAMLASIAPDHVVHAAGRLSGDMATLETDNLRATETLADATFEVAPNAVLTALGSAAEYGPPLRDAPIREDHPCAPVNDYGRTKLAATRALLDRAEQGLRVNIIRPFNPIGVPLSRAQVLGSFVEKARAARAAGNTAVIMDRLDAVRDVFAVADLLDLLKRLVVDGRHGLIVNACSGVPRRMRDLVAFLNGLPGGGFVVEEMGVRPQRESVVIGDPARFLALIGHEQACPIEPLLVDAWSHALGK